MPGPSPTPLVLDDALLIRLRKIARAAKTPQAIALRAKIVLECAAGNNNAEVSRRRRCSVNTVREWRRRFAADPRVATLRDLPRSGRPSVVPMWVRAKLVSLACRRPDKRRFRVVWSLKALRAALLVETGWALSVSEIGRILRHNDLKPHLVRLWLKSQDPDFRPKVKAICDIYTSPPADTVVLCVDEKRLFVRSHNPPLQAARRGRPGRRDSDYQRHGSSVLLAAWNIRSGQVFAKCRKQRKGDDLVEFMEQVAEAYPNTKVIIIWDNLNIHYDGKSERWTRFNERHGGRFQFVYTPKHASWVNQVELFFSIVERRVLKHESFKTLDAVNSRVIGFIDHWNEFEAHPFKWTFRGTWGPPSNCALANAYGCTTDRLLGSRRPAAEAA